MLPTSNTIVYIDGFNLYYSLKDTPYKWLNIEKLISLVLDPSLNKIIKIKYFTAKTPFSNSTQNQNVWLTALRTLQKVEIVYGKFKKRHIKIKNNQIERLSILQGNSKNLEQIKSLLRGSIFQFPKHEEKETDVNIATHIIYDCCKGNVDYVVLLSNDTDLKLPLRFARNKLRKKIVVITPFKVETHMDLRRISNKTLRLKESHLKESQFPNRVNGMFKPKNWS